MALIPQDATTSWRICLHLPDICQENLSLSFHLPSFRVHLKSKLLFQIFTDHSSQHGSFPFLTSQTHLIICSLSDFLIKIFVLLFKYSCLHFPTTTLPRPTHHSFIVPHFISCFKSYFFMWRHFYCLL